jgi:hypothetical protein
MRRLTLLTDTDATSVRTTATLFDLNLLPSAGGALMIAGVELVADTRRAINEHSQVWFRRTRAEHGGRNDVPLGIDHLMPETVVSMSHVRGSVRPNQGGCARLWQHGAQQITE